MSINFRVPKPSPGGLLRMKVSGYRHPTRSLLIYALVDGTPNIRIYLPGEVFPIHLRRFLRQVYLHVYQPAQHDSEGKQISPTLYGFHPLPGVLIVIDPGKPAFFLRDSSGEREIVRDERSRLVLS